MQNIANGIQNLTGGMGAKQEEEELKRFTGLEFVLVHARAPLCFVVAKRWRTSPTESKSPVTKDEEGGKERERHGEAERANENLLPCLHGCGLKQQQHR